MGSAAPEPPLPGARASSLRNRPAQSPRAGGVLLLVLCTMAILLSTTFLAAAVFRSRARLTRDTLHREAARDRLLVCVSNAVETLLADTNGVDHLGEPWAADLAEPPFRCRLQDESALLPLATADTNLLAAALAGARAAQAGAWGAEPPEGFAAHLAAWRDRGRAAHQGEDPPAFGFYADALRGLSGAEAAADALRAASTPYGTGPVNLNTVSPEVMEILLRGCGAPPEMAGAMAANLAFVRASGAVAADAGPRTLRRLLLDGGRPASDAEAKVLDAAAPLLGASSHLFRGRFECAHPAVAVEFVFDREAKRLLLWDESPLPR